MMGWSEKEATAIFLELPKLFRKHRELNNKWNELFELTAKIGRGLKSSEDWKEVEKKMEGTKEIQEMKEIKSSIRFTMEHIEKFVFSYYQSPYEYLITHSS